MSLVWGVPSLILNSGVVVGGGGSVLYAISLFGVLNRVSFWTRSVERGVNFGGVHVWCQQFLFWKSSFLMLSVLKGQVFLKGLGSTAPPNCRAVSHTDACRQTLSHVFSAFLTAMNNFKFRQVQACTIFVLAI